MPNHMCKARLVEDVVALLHQDDRLAVTPRAKLPSLSTPSDEREIDVLVTGSLASYPITVGIECKNYAETIGVPHIDEFAGKLEDVGIPVSQGVYVSVNGYTRNAINRAKTKGIRLLTLNGLTTDRLHSEIFRAFQSTVYLLLCIEQLTVTATGQDTDPWDLMWTKDSKGNYDRGVLDMIWGQWRERQLDASLGQHQVSVDLPKDWYWHGKQPDELQSLTVGVRVIGLVLHHEGTAKRHALSNVVTSRTERLHIRAAFDPVDSLPVTTVTNDDELDDALTTDGVVNVVFERQRLPRILVMNKTYWPPSKKTAQFMFAKVQELLAQGDYTMETMQSLTLAEIEGTNLARIWDPIWSEHPGASSNRWPFVKRRIQPVYRPRSSRPSNRRFQRGRKAVDLDLP